MAGQIASWSGRGSAVTSTTARQIAVGEVE
jgi:hypothetical protein